MLGRHLFHFGEDSHSGSEGTCKGVSHGQSGYVNVDSCKKEVILFVETLWSDLEKRAGYSFCLRSIFSSIMIILLALVVSFLKRLLRSEMLIV